MKTQKIKTFLLGASALAGVALTSCGKEQSSKQETSVPQKQEQKFDVEAARKKYKEFCVDSIRVANGDNDLRAQQYQLFDSIHAVEAKKETIKWESSLGGAIQTSVESAGYKILDNFIKELDILLGKYKISLKSHLHVEDDMYWAFDNKDEYDGVSHVCKTHLVYTGITDVEEYDFYENPYEQLIQNIGNIIDESQYGQQRKDEIMVAVRKLIEQTKKKLLASRKSIEAQFSDYYVAMDGEELALGYAGEGDTGYGYDHMNYHGRGILAKTKLIHVYDSKLPVEFFGNPDDEYKLISLGNNKWYVQKKTSSGKIEKTAVFTDAGKISESVSCYDKEWFQDGYDFSYIPGDNIGVHIKTCETTVLKTAKKQWVCPKTAVKEINYFEQLQQQLERQDSLLSAQRDSIAHYADSVANVMAMRKYPKTR